jgi:hypothetical protein
MILYGNAVFVRWHVFLGEIVAFAPDNYERNSTYHLFSTIISPPPPEIANRARRLWHDINNTCYLYP